MGFVSFLFRNWPLKLLALALSFFLWATYTAEPLAEAGYSVPVIFRNLPPGMDLSGVEISQVHVVLRGRSALLRRLEPKDLALQVDLAGRADGEFTFNFTPAHLEIPLGADLVRILPAEVRVRLLPRSP